MTAPRQALDFADAGEAVDLAAFLARLIHYDRAAAVRLQARGTKLAVFGRPPSFEVLAIRTARLAKPYESGPETRHDVTVSAGELLETLDEQAGTGDVPGAVTGPPWAGVLPPHGGWQPEPGLPGPEALRATVARVVAEFRSRTEELAPEGRTRAALDRIGAEIWSRPVGDTHLPVRAAHAAQVLGFLRVPAPPGVARDADPASPSAAHPGTRVEAGPEAGAGITLLSAGSWLRLRTPFGAIAVRRAGFGALSVTPT